MVRAWSGQHGRGAIRGASCLLLMGLWLGSSPGTAVGLDLDRIAIRPATLLDTLRFRTQCARLSLDWSRAAGLRDSVLELHPGDGFALREIAVEASERGLLGPLSQILVSGQDRPPIPIGRLSEEDRAFLAGLLFFYQGRYRSASGWFDRAIALRSFWGWPRFYRARAGHELLEPTPVWQARLDSALTDPEVHPAVVDWLLVNRPRSYADLVEANAPRLTRWARSLPWTAPAEVSYNLVSRFAALRPSPAELDRLWHSARTELADGAMAVMRDFGFVIRYRLLPRDGLALLERWERESAPLARPRWIRHHALLLSDVGRETDADSLLDHDPLRDGEALAHQLYLRAACTPPAQLQVMAERLSAEALDQGRTVEYVLNLLGRTQVVGEIRQELSRENPREAAETRLDGLMASDPDAARALVDSLEAAGAPPETLPWYRVAFAERRGDTLSVPALLSFKPRYGAAQHLHAAASAAFERGLTERGRRLSLLALDQADATLTFWIKIGDEAARRGDRSTLDGIRRRLEANCGETPRAAEAILRWGLRDQAPDATRERLRKWLRAPSVPPWFLAQLAISAEALGDRSLADSCLARALRTQPVCRDVRYVEAWLKTQRGDAASASTILQTLVQEFPGDQASRALLASAGGAQEDAHPPDDAVDFSRAFDTFDHDLVSTDWIRARIAETDTLDGEPVVYLQNRASYVCRYAQGYRVRLRLVIGIRTPQAVESYRTLRLAFHPWQGAPRIRVARVVHPDGRIVETPRGEIVVASPTEQDGSRVSDERHLVIPFGGLEPGAAIDVVWEENQPSLIGGAWSFRRVLSERHPTRESLLEIASPSGSPVRLRRSEGLPEPERSTVGSYSIARWIVRGLPAVVDVPLAGSLYDRYPWVGCSGYESWARCVDAYRQDFWRQADSSEAIRALADSLSRGARSAEQKLQLILDYVASRVKYLAIELGRGRVVPTAAAAVLERGFGDCKDMVVLTLSLLRAAGIDAQPVLVVPRNQATIYPDLAEPGLFTHIILWVPGRQGGVYCDATERPACVGVVGAEYAGSRGLRFGNTGDATLVTIPEAPVKEHGYSMELDIKPTGDGTAEIGVRARYRGELARTARGALVIPDTALASFMVDRVLGFGLPETARRTGWKLEADRCSELTATASYVDTAWNARSHSVTFAVKDEVADPFLEYPDPEGMREDLHLLNGYRDTVLVRLHSGWGWEPVARLAEIKVKQEGFQGSVSVRSGTEAGDRFVEIRQTFEMRQQRMTPEKYRAFHRSWLRFLAVVYQPYAFRRSLDAKHLAEIGGYVREHPEDYAYVMQVVGEILGDDLGGAGPEGAARRDGCRELLRPLRAQADAGPQPLLLLAALEIYDGRLRAADSLSVESLGRESGNSLGLAYRSATRGALGDRDGERQYLKELARRVPSDELELQLINLHYRDRRDDEARSLESRYRSLHGPTDSTRILIARVNGFLTGGRCEEAFDAFQLLRNSLPEKSAHLLESSLELNCGSVAKAASLLERMWLEDPLSPFVCNNLAWAYIRLGRDLELAEEIVRTSIALGSGKGEAARNTLGALMARRGHWKEARGVFQEILDQSERRDDQVVNEYFVALCDFHMDQRGEAVIRWKRALELAPPGEWRDRIQRTLELEARGTPVTGAIFVEPDSKGNIRPGPPATRSEGTR